MSRSSTSISNRTALAHVGRRAGLFLAPVLFVAGFAEAVFWRARECWPAAWVLAEWKKDPLTIYGPRYFSPQVAWLKTELIRADRPRIIALGSSRVTQFRARMFGPLEGAFFNAGQFAGNTAELESAAALFLRGDLPKPQVMIVGVDPWWMKIPADGVHRDPPPGPITQTRPVMSAAAHLEALRLFLRKPDFPVTLLWPGSSVKNEDYGRNAIGLGALAGNGYRRDGSVLQTGVIQDYLRTGAYRDREEPPGLARIRAHTHQFWVTEGLDWAQAERVIAALRALRAAGIEVYAVLPPFSSEADKALASDPALSRWYGEYCRDLPRRLAAEGFVCAHGRSPAAYGMTDDAMIDGYHPGDVLVACIVEDLVRQAAPGSVLRSIPVAALQRLRNAPGVVPISLDPPGLR